MSKSVLTCFAAVLAVLVSLTGCGSADTAPQSATPVAQFEEDSQSTCFTALTPEQEGDLREYVAQNQDTVNEATGNAGDQSLCVLESDGNGGYTQRYYQEGEESNFDDYLLYSLLLGHSNTLLTYGLLSGDLDFGQVMALSLLTGVNSHGHVYHPYSKHHDSNKWSRTPSVASGQVRLVAYGQHAKPLVFDNSKMLKVPAGFVSKRIPAPTDKVVEFAAGPAGKPVIKSQSNTGAKAAIDSQKKTNQAAVPSTSTKSKTNQSGGSKSDQKQKQQKPTTPKVNKPPASKKK